MSVQLIRAKEADAPELWRMQREAFAELLAKYQDYEISPANEPLEKVLLRLRQPFTYFYFIAAGDESVGAIRVVDRKDGSRKRISPLFIMPGCRGRGWAQAAMHEAEQIHGTGGWQLDTILQETGNCCLYEKMGYRRTGKMEVINERMTIVYYEKN